MSQTKKVILVGGTAYSGSTFFHMMLAHDPHGFATGEVRSFLEPRKSNHQHLSCTCPNDPCSFWETVKTREGENWFDIAFEYEPDTKLVVASSKSPIWIAQQNELLAKRGIDCHNVLIWKTPTEFAQSMKRRKEFEYWERSWINYYRLYAALVPNWRAVKYEHLVKQGDSLLETICRYVEIPFFEGKENYWQRDYHVLSGNSSARFHLYNDQKAEEIVSGHDQERLNFYRKIYYRAPDDEQVITAVSQAYHRNPQLCEVEYALMQMDVTKTAVVPDQVLAPIKMSTPAVLLRQFKDFAVTQVGKVRYS